MVVNVRRKKVIPKSLKKGKISAFHDKYGNGGNSYEKPYLKYISTDAILENKAFKNKIVMKIFCENSGFDTNIGKKTFRR